MAHGRASAESVPVLEREDRPIPAGPGKPCRGHRTKSRDPQSGDGGAPQSYNWDVGTVPHPPLGPRGSTISVCVCMCVCIYVWFCAFVWVSSNYPVITWFISLLRQSFSTYLCAILSDVPAYKSWYWLRIFWRFVNFFLSLLQLSPSVMGYILLNYYMLQLY